MFGSQRPDCFVAQVKLGDNGHNAERAQQVNAVAADFGAQGFSQTDAYLRFTFRRVDDLKPFLSGIESIGRDVEVVSVGRRLEIVKQVGSPSHLEKAFHISRFRGRHGIGHTRLSTESVVDLSHSQPFWGHGYPDLAIVHNGHITNYHQLRRRYEQRGVRFYTENDSEIVATFLANKLRQGATFAHRDGDACCTELDGSFSCLVATDCEFGFVKDPFSFKPLWLSKPSNLSRRLRKRSRFAPPSRVTIQGARGSSPRKCRYGRHRRCAGRRRGRSTGEIRQGDRRRRFRKIIV